MRTPGRTPFPELVRPMLAEAGPLPEGADEPAWAYEMKWDGVRAVVYVAGGGAGAGGGVRILSRTDRDVSGTYPEVHGLAGALAGAQVVLDGEIVAVDAAGRPSFAQLQQRMHVTSPAQVRRLTDLVPVTFLAFDVMHLQGRSLLSAPYDERRAILEGLELAAPHWQAPSAFPGDAAAAMAMSEQAGLEGVVAKRRTSPYEPGRRAPSWRKVKRFRTQEVVVGGWKPGEGRRAGGIGSLLLGVPAQGGLRYAGHVGTGFTTAMLGDLAARLRPLQRSSPPFVDEVPRLHARDAHWVEPRLVGEVAYGEWTRDGRLRHPSWRGLRGDKGPGDVVRED